MIAVVYHSMLVVPQWARPALGAMLAAAVTFVPMDSAFASVDTTALLAGRSGGRVGGRVSAPRMAPRSGGGNDVSRASMFSHISVRIRRRD